MIRTRPLLRHLVQKAAVDVLAYEVGSIDADIAERVASLRAIPVRLEPNTSAVHRIRTFFSPHDVQPWYRSYSEALAERLSGSEYDLIWVAGWKMLLYLPEVRRLVSPRTKIIADVVDDELLGNWRDLRGAKGPRSRATMARRLLRNSLYQRRFLAHADLALFVAENDANSTRARMPRLRVEVNQNGVDTDYFAPAPPSGKHRDEGPVLLFEGTMSYGPNVEGALYLVKRVLPIVQRSVPDARVLIVGRNPTPEIEALAAHDVEVTGTVDDVRSDMRRGAMLACSLRSGTGLKNKILQSWAMGIPVVATPISVPGLGAIHDVNVLIAEGPEAFAAQCVRLLEAPSLAERIGNAGRRMALDRYSMHVKLGEIDSFIEELVGPRTFARASTSQKQSASP
ncbi:glycosyltransferase family 4 protein [Planctomycetes bacterium Poly30]|uniref:glycosyltransferase family 4 protein n=1 Tax=Saltatorellus ferox TaxID=2528018 RepID=UPI0011A88B55